ncbi:serine hydrolase domain-containing protein [Vulgatibacter sp.]|uniref:serine hydrolase domain-containing protein n=1 Tax=Vulgatibacter sp. TaxID=1971226 RepID=UPI00356B0CE5
MRPFAAALFALLSACSTTGTPQQIAAPVEVLDDGRAARLQALVAQLARPPFATAASLSVSTGGEVSSITAGEAWAGGPAVADETRFNQASVSKLITAARVVALVHEGRLGLDDSVRQHLPGVRLVDAAGTDHAGSITLRQLLQHRGGLPHQPASLDPSRVGSSWGDPALLTKLASAWSVQLVAEPGTYRYSNLGYALLAAVTEKVEGRTFPDALDPWLAGKELPHATFRPALLQEGAAHGSVEREGAVAFLPPGWYASSYALPFTGLWASTPDMVRFGRHLADAAGDPAAPLHAMTQLDTATGHGLGPVHRSRFGMRSLEHDGAGPGFLAWLVVIPERDLVLAVACNTDGEARANGQRFAAHVNEMLQVVVEPPP